MNPAQFNAAPRNTVREPLGVVAKLIAVIVATFVFAAFSREPASLHDATPGAQTTSAHAPNQPR